MYNYYVNIYLLYIKWTFTYIYSKLRKHLLTVYSFCVALRRCLAPGLSRSANRPQRGPRDSLFGLLFCFCCCCFCCCCCCCCCCWCWCCCYWILCLICLVSCLSVIVCFCCYCTCSLLFIVVHCCSLLFIVVVVHCCCCCCCHYLLRTHTLWFAVFSFSCICYFAADMHFLVCSLLV